MIDALARRLLPGGLICVALAAPGIVCRAQTTDLLAPTTALVGLSGTPAATETNFTIASAEDLVVTLTDLQAPAALASASVVVTQGGAIIGDATFASPATSATVTIPAAVGQYTLRVFGAPNASFSVGTFTVCVAPQSSPSNCITPGSTAGNISTPSTAANPAISTLSLTLTVATGGTYTVAFTDDQFPAALASAPNLALFQGNQAIGTAIPSGTSFNLSAGVYTLLAIAQASQTTQAGLYGISITGPGGAPLLTGTYPVGVLAPSFRSNNPSAQSLTLQVTDYAFPSALTTASALATAGATVLGSTSIGAVGGPAVFAAPAGTVQVWSFATPGTNAGTYEIDLTAASGSLLQTAAAVNNGSSLAYAYVTAAVAAGSYQATAADFQFPAVLPTLQFAVAQNGAILQQAASASTLNFTATAAPVILLANAKPPTSGNGLFDVNVQTAGAAPQLVFDQTQPVSLTDLFDTQTLNIGASGNFVLTLTDLKFPAQFQDLDLVVSSGGSVVGTAIGGGNFPIAATPGTYQLTFIATPAAQQQYGMYALQIVSAPPAVTLTASPTTVAANATTTLTWTSTNATSCTGSGGAFAGSQPISGNTAVVVSTTTNFTLTCTGAGGTNAQSVTVTATQSSGSRGGGQFDMRVLGVLGMLVLMRMRRRLMN